MEIKFIESFKEELRRRKKQNILEKEVKRLHNEGAMVKVVIGAGGISLEGWLVTDLPILDALKRADWKRIFSQGIIDRILAEHVIEHWTVDEFRLFLGIVRPFLSQQGFIRLAVPDGFHSDPFYIDHVKPGGRGNGADDHKVLYNYMTITCVLSEEQYDYNLLEYFDELGQFHRFPWKPSNGFVVRSADHDPRNPERPLTYTSLIVDAWPSKR